MKTLLLIACIALLAIPLATAGRTHAAAGQFAWQTLKYDYFSAVDYESVNCDPGSPNSTGTCNPSTDVYNPGVPGDPLVFPPTTPECAWDSDDAISMYGSGDLAGNATSGITFCVIHDSFDHPEYSRHPTAVILDAPSAALSVQITNDGDPTLDVTAPPPVAIKGGYEYHVCFTRRIGVVGQQFPVIPYSNGGTGQQVETTVQVTNPTGKTVHGITARATNGFYNNPYLDWNIGC
jgi:hypothetical protein